MGVGVTVEDNVDVDPTPTAELYRKHYGAFLPRDALLVRHRLWAGVCVRHKSVFCRNGWTTDPAVLGFLRPIIYFVRRKFGYLQNEGTVLFSRTMSEK